MNEEFRQAWSVCREDILAFCRLLKFVPWSQQKEILLAAQELTLNDRYSPKRLIAKSGQGLGKTAVMVVIGLWRHFRSPGTLTLVIAPTERQAKDIFFSELRRILLRAPAFFLDIVTLSATRMSMKDNPEWRIQGVCASTPETAAGWHHETLTILVEEISGIEDNILEAFLGTASQRENLVVGIGNPTRLEGYLYDAFTMDDYAADNIWPFRFTLSKLTLSQERPELADPQVIESIRNQYGEDSNFWLIRVLGEFPNTGSETIIPRRSLEIATQTPAWKAIREASQPGLRRIGVDFSGSGPNGDENAIFMRAGNAITDWWVSNCEPYEALERAFYMQEAHGWTDDECLYVVDSVGVGQGMLHFLVEAEKRYVAFGSHHMSGDMEHANLETRAWFRAKDLLTTQICSIPDDKEFLSQIAARHFEFNGKNELMVESKKAYKKRTKRKSPDRGDAFIECFAADEVTLGIQQVIR